MKFPLESSFLRQLLQSVLSSLVPPHGGKLVNRVLIEKPDPEGPMGAKGVGEHVLIPTAPAILNAIHHATGAWVDRLPALPHRVLAAMRAAPRTSHSAPTTSRPRPATRSSTFSRIEPTSVP